MSADMLTKLEILGALRDEIKWCKRNPMDVSADYRRGFIKGLQQAMRMVMEARTVRVNRD